MNEQEASALLNVRIPVMGTELDYAYSRLKQEIETQANNNMLTGEQAQSRFRQIEQAYQVLKASMLNSPVYGMDNPQASANTPLELPEIQLPPMPQWDTPTAIAPIELPPEVPLPEPAQADHEPAIQPSSSTLPANQPRQSARPEYTTRVPARSTAEEVRLMKTSANDAGRKQQKHASTIIQRRNELRQHENRQSPTQRKNPGFWPEDEDMRNFVRVAYGGAVFLCVLSMFARNAVVFALGLELGLVALVASNAYGIATDVFKLSRYNNRATRQTWIYLIAGSFILFLILGSILFSGGR